MRVVGATTIQSIGVLLLMHIGESGAPATDMRLGLAFGALHIAVGAAVLDFRPSVPAVGVFLLPEASSPSSPHSEEGTGPAPGPSGSPPGPSYPANSPQAHDEAGLTRFHKGIGSRAVLGVLRSEMELYLLDC